MSNKGNSNSKLVLKLLCEWEGCKVEFNCMNNFLTHIDQHLSCFYSDGQTIRTGLAIIFE